MNLRLVSLRRRQLVLFGTLFTVSLLFAYKECIFIAPYTTSTNNPEKKTHNFRAGHVGGGRVVVTGASSNHFDTLCAFLHNFKLNNPTSIPLIVYNLGLSVEEKKIISSRVPSASILDFDFELYPSFFDIKSAAGEYAWKPIIISETLLSFDRVLWLDTGNRLANTEVLRRAFAFIERDGFLTTQTSGTTQMWVHSDSLKFFNASKLDVQMCNGAIVGFDRTHSQVMTKIVSPWRECALLRECIAPLGSSRANHRQDQATLTVLIYQSGRGCEAEDFDVSSLGIVLHQDFASFNFCTTTR